MSAMREIAIVGGGVTGLTAALTLLERSGDAANVTVLEARERAGGHACTLRDSEYLIERGPNGFLENDASRTVLDSLSLGREAIEASAVSKHRYVVRGGRLREVPSSPFALLFGDVLSPAGRLRVLGEPWIRSRSPERESVFDFARRRIGAEAAQVLVDAAVGGITAGDSRTLEIESAFPALVEMEREHGSLIRALVHRARTARGNGRERAAGGARTARPRLISFAGGVSELVRAFERRLGSRLRTRAAVRSLRRAGERWHLECADGRALEADAVLVAAQARGAAAVLRTLDPVLATLLGGVPFSGVAVAALAYRNEQLTRPLDGYGFLVPAAERGRTLGAVWESSLFPGRAPQGHALIRAMIGGAREPHAIEESDDHLLARARADLARFVGIEATPERVWIERAPEAIAQYANGHAARLAEIRAAAARHRGLILCGTSYDGVSLGAAMAAGERAARAVLQAPVLEGAAA